jgi:hypothetical protein
LAKLKGMEIQEASSNGGSLPAYDWFVGKSGDVQMENIQVDREKGVILKCPDIKGWSLLSTDGTTERVRKNETCGF